MLDRTEDDTKIARSSFHCQSTSSVSLEVPAGNGLGIIMGGGEGHYGSSDRAIANGAPAPKSRPGALI